MLRIIDRVKQIFSAPQPLQAGNFSYHTPDDAPTPYRIHLRLEENGEGLLIINASTVLHLNQTAAEYAYHFISQTPLPKIRKIISSRYKISPQQAEQDYQTFSQQIQEIIYTPDLDPVTFLNINRSKPYSKTLSAPYRLDCALTYRYEKTQVSTENHHKNVKRELNTEEWLKIINISWKVGIPHIIFSGGEPTLREDLITLLNAVELNGQVSGLITNGLRLSDETYFQQLKQTGLDHIMMVLDADKEESWASLKVILPDDLFTAIHITITPQNKSQVPSIINKLAQMGANGVSLSISEPSLEDTLQQAHELTARSHLNPIWDLPVPFSNLNPHALEVSSEELTQGAGKAWLYIEPDGDVLPAQGIPHLLGNILQDDWNSIWQKAQVYHS